MRARAGEARERVGKRSAPTRNRLRSPKSHSSQPYLPTHAAGARAEDSYGESREIHPRCSVLPVQGEPEEARRPRRRNSAETWTRRDRRPAAARARAARSSARPQVRRVRVVHVDPARARELLRRGRRRGPAPGQGHGRARLRGGLDDDPLPLHLRGRHGRHAQVPDGLRHRHLPRRRHGHGEPVPHDGRHLRPVVGQRGRGQGVEEGRGRHLHDVLVLPLRRLRLLRVAPRRLPRVFRRLFRSASARPTPRPAGNDLIKEDSVASTDVDVSVPAGDAPAAETVEPLPEEQAAN